MSFLRRAAGLSLRDQAPVPGIDQTPEIIMHKNKILDYVLTNPLWQSSIKLATATLQSSSFTFYRRFFLARGPVGHRRQPCFRKGTSDEFHLSLRLLIPWNLLKDCPHP